MPNTRMTRQHFVAIAAGIADVRDRIGPEAATIVARSISGRLSMFNPLYNRERFIAAAAGEPLHAVDAPRPRFTPAPTPKEN